MITRARLEAHGETAEQVQEELIDGLSWLRKYVMDADSWEITDEEVQTSKDGFWGFIVMKRMTDGKS